MKEGEKKNAITRPFKYLPNDETERREDFASNRVVDFGRDWFQMLQLVRGTALLFQMR